MAVAIARPLIRRLFFPSSTTISPPPTPKLELLANNNFATSTTRARRNKTKANEITSSIAQKKKSRESLVKKRTRSEKEFDEDSFLKLYGNENASHVPVLLGEVLDVFASLRLRSFVDCTLGAAGHSSAIIQAHPEMQVYVGLDVDPLAHQMALDRINVILKKDSSYTDTDLKVHTYLKNFKDVKSVLCEVDKGLLTSGIDGILMDLGMSSMQVNDAERGFSVLKDGPLDMRMDPKATLKAEDILNSWPAAEVGRILRDYGEESNWHFLQNKIVKARLSGGLHSTGQLVDLIQNSTSRTKGRQGWIKTATRVFQALRIAVNDELRTLEDSIYSCFNSLAPGGRLAIISFHSLEDRIVKQAFLSVMNGGGIKGEEERCCHGLKTFGEDGERETWVKQIMQGQNGTILTKRPITPSQKEEMLNSRSRSAKLRVIQKV
nr:ribosomal RNA small subunit methyltransferase H-like [Ipomoea batatas]